MLLLQWLFNTVINLYIVVVIVTVIASWLIAFGIVNSHNNIVRTILQVCYALTEPLLAPIRRFIPSVGGLDLSPLILLIALQAVQFAGNVYIFNPLIASGLR